MIEEKTLTEKIIEEQKQIEEDYWQYIQYLPEAYCQMCDSDKNICDNAEESSKEQYPHFCENCEDASEVINLKQMFVATIQDELHSHRTTILNEVKGEVNKNKEKDCGWSGHGVLPLHMGEYEQIQAAKDFGFRMACDDILTTIEEMKDK